MPKTNRPRRGSLAYSPRKRAKSPIPRYQSWADPQGEPTLQGIAGYKVGMTHVIMVDDHKFSPTEGKDIMVPVTIVEIPPMKVAALRAYTFDSYGAHAMTEVWAEAQDRDLSRRISLPKEHDRPAAIEKITAGIKEGAVCDVFVLAHTIPDRVSGIPKKVPDLMEIRIGGKDLQKRFDYGLSILGTEIQPSGFIDEGTYVDVTAITKGKGTQGPVKRWGVKLRKRKHAVGRERHIGNLGPWNPHHVRWQVPQLGQMGYQQRTEFNKRLLKVGTSGEEVTPAGGFLHYGLVRNPYLVIKGSIPGPVKRLVRVRPAIRRGEHKVRVPVIEFVSTQSKQG
jgi:large subunit ribosomal protein L3